MSMKSVVALAAVGFPCVAALGSITIPTVPIGNVGNAADPTTGFGTVRYQYNIGTTEVTNAQYAAFLNAVAATDENTLYRAAMANPFGGITRSGSPGSYTYSTVSGRENNPVNYVNFWSAARFTNWLHNGQPTGPQNNSTTEDGAYTLTPDAIGSNTVARNSDWRWALPSQNEWYKATYHQPASLGGDADDYWRYPTASNTITTAQANYDDLIGNTTPVGSYAANFYGLFDAGGNVYEWNEAIADDLRRGVRGGSYINSESILRSSFEFYNFASNSVVNFGFRVVTVPSPSAAALLGLGGLLSVRRRR